MSENLHSEAFERIQRHLSKPTLPMIHALIFGICVSVSGFLSSMSAGYVYGIDIVIYLTAVVWSVLLFAHSFRAYRHSAATKTHRENVIQDQLLRLANEYDLSADELADLHERISDDVSQRAAPFMPLMISTGSYVALWIGGLVFGQTLLTFRSMTADNLNLIMQGIPLIGTYIITAQVIAGFVLRRGKVEDADVRTSYLRAIYTTKTQKRKRLATERLTIDDEGEIVPAHDYTAQQEKQR